MKRSFLLLSICVLFLSINREVYTQSAAVILRPAYTDISDQASRGAVLIKLTGYSSADARYRLFNGATQYNCWSPASGTYVTSNSYSSGASAAGDPTIESIFWVVWQRGSNNSTTATYRDRLGPDYSVNYQSAALPTSEPVTSPFSITGRLEASSVNTLDVKYVLLAWSGSTLVSASHSDPFTGDFTVVCQEGLVIDRLEARTLTNDLCSTKNGSWSVSSDAGIMVLSDVLEVAGNEFSNNKIVLYPVPAGDYLKLSGFSGNETMEIVNLAGVKVMNIRKDQIMEERIPTGFLPAGVYFLKVSGKQGVRVYRFVKY